MEIRAIDQTDIDVFADSRLGNLRETTDGINVLCVEVILFFSKNGILSIMHSSLPKVKLGNLRCL